MVAILMIAFGDIEVPCRIFKDMQSGIDFCNELFNKAGCDPVVSDDLTTYFYNYELKEGDVVSDELFVSYYYGANEYIDTYFVLKEVDFNSKIVNFSVD
ncbi:MAG: hypothetical protein PVG39_04740 [Desulfobacteraceae bacterium]|jgi:hypothetical protein